MIKYFFTDKSCSWNIVKYLSNVPITSLELEDRTGKHSVFRGSFNDWLCSLKDLKRLHLIITGFKFNNLMTHSLTSAKFKLREFSINVLYMGISAYDKRMFWNFYASQKELETMHIQACFEEFDDYLGMHPGIDFHHLKAITLGVQYNEIFFPSHVLKVNKMNELVTSLTYQKILNKNANPEHRNGTFVKFLPNSGTVLLKHLDDTNILKSLGELCMNVRN